MGDSYLKWIRELAEEFAIPGDRLGTLARIDPTSRQRAAAAVRTASAVTLARTLTEGPSVRHDLLPGFELETFYSDEPVGVYTDRSIGIGTDHVRLDCHGIDNTHLDALNHTAVDGHWYGGRAVGAPDVPDLLDIAREGIVARAIHLDIAALRGTPWVSVDSPVTGEELARALAATGASLERGDVLIVDMGRDRFEEAGGGVRDATRPGIGESGARWIAAQPIAAVAWDFLDAKHPDEPPACVHLLNWAIGLILIDNCDFARAREPFVAAGSIGMLATAPLPIARATGGNVNPHIIF